MGGNYNSPNLLSALSPEYEVRKEKGEDVQEEDDAPDTQDYDDAKKVSQRRHLL